MTEKDLEEYLVGLAEWFSDTWREEAPEYNRGAQEAIDIIREELAGEITNESEDKYDGQSD